MLDYLSIKASIPHTIRNTPITRYNGNQLIRIRTPTTIARIALAVLLSVKFLPAIDMNLLNRELDGRYEASPHSVNHRLSISVKRPIYNMLHSCNGHIMIRRRSYDRRLEYMLCQIILRGTRLPRFPRPAEVGVERRCHQRRDLLHRRGAAGFSGKRQRRSFAWSH